MMDHKKAKMKQRYSYELPKWMKLLGIWRVNEDSVDAKWGYFAPRAGLEFYISRGGYFDQRYEVSFALGWGKFMIRLPFKTKLKEGCDAPKYGFAVHNNTFWIYIGGEYDESMGQCTGNDQWITWDLPFFSWEFDGHWIREKRQSGVFIQSGDWIKIGKMDAYSFRKDMAYTETHEFVYTLKNGMVQWRTATCTIEKRKWYRKWFPWLKKTSHVIDIEFNDEVGNRSGTWKGGIMGMTHELHDGETIKSSLKRLEQDKTL